MVVYVEYANKKVKNTIIWVTCFHYFTDFSLANVETIKFSGGAKARGIAMVTETSWTDSLFFVGRENPLLILKQSNFVN